MNISLIALVVSLIVALVIVGAVLLVVVLMTKNKKPLVSHENVFESNIRNNSVRIINCPKCGCPSGDGGEYCFECGAKIR